jgi:hypothetical protein
MGNQGQDQKTVGYGFSLWTLFGHRFIDVYPLSIAGGIGESIDSILVDFEPVANR